MKTAEIRRRFLDFFVRNDHTEVPSASLMHHDPTLLFVNAGMVPFKPYFIGAEDAPYARATSVQKCVRTLDIEEVGKTTRHGTFFQMNGNFSFGDYFKEEAIAYAWEFSTGAVEDGNLGFDPERIWVTVLDGDEEAEAYWKSVGMPADRIQHRGLADNYWNMGVPGPGGPCSEIYFDRGPEYGPDGGPEADEDRFLEFWNLVFMQEELATVRSKTDFDVARPLPRPNIDTGMGLERVAYLMQGKQNMYEIDQVFPVISRAAELSGREYGADATSDVRLRVVADHVRSGMMLINDGVTPGNEGRGYVLRRLLRRAVRAMRLLGVTDPVLPELFPLSRDVMADSYTEIAEQWQRISDVAYAEEDAFRRTLEAGTQIFDVAVSDAKKSQASVLPGAQAFQLHDTYGFPIDLTMEMAAEHGLKVDRDEFSRLMTEQRERAKADAKAKKGGATNVEAYRELRHGGESTFIGYTELETDARVLGIVDAGSSVPAASAGSVVEIVLDTTPFYAESGGQDADRGTITAPGLELKIVDVQSPVQGLIVHRVEVVSGEVTVDQQVHARVDADHRAGACRAHSATHIVHAVLRETVGPTAVQAGSYNKPGYLRFDFQSTHGLDADQRAEIEGRSNEAITADHEVTSQTLPLNEAREMGAMAMFGEKYPDMVRMVEMNGPWSRELCGGTHVRHSSQIGLLTLLNEQSIGSGVRRVEAFVSTDAFRYLAAERALVSNLSGMLKVQPDQLTERVGKLVADLKDAEKQLAAHRSKEILGNAAGLVESAQDRGGVAVVAQHVAGVGGGDLRQLAQEIRGRLGDRPGVVALVGGTDEKPAVVVATTTGARERGLRAGALVKDACAALGGRGGGKDDLAQGGGSDSTGIDKALASVEAAVDAA